MGRGGERRKRETSGKAMRVKARGSSDRGAGGESDET